MGLQGGGGGNIKKGTGMDFQNRSSETLSIKYLQKAISLL